MAHWLLTVTLRWKYAGIQLLVPALWQLSQLGMLTPVSNWFGMWLDVRPLAIVPLWQVAHWAVTTCCVWFQVDGVHAFTVWQAMQFAVVGRWLAFLPLAVLPLWQLAQLVAGVKRLWFGRVVESQLAVELWQFSQVPVTPAWMAVFGFAVWP